MPSITHVKRAQPRYEMKPVLDDDGNPKRVPVMKNGKQQTTKHGKAVTMALTVRDTDRPKPLLKCGACHQPIELGTPYKHMTVKSTYGGTRYNRHESCPDWQPWEYSNALWAQVARIQADGHAAIDEAEITSEDDVEGILESVADDAQSLADEKNEAADSLEEGFGHETYQSEEIRGNAEALEEWAEAMRSVEVPSMPDPESVTKWYATGPGGATLNDDGFDDKDDAQAAIDEYLGDKAEQAEADEWEVHSEEEEGEELSEDQLSDWVEEVRDALRTAVDDCAVG